MKILVTGGCGFIGTNFIKIALDKKYEVLNIDSLTYASSKEKEIFSNKKHTFINSNIGNKKKISKVLNKFNPAAIVNFASETHVDRSIYNPEIFFKTNIIDTVRFLDTAKNFFLQKNKKNFRFIHISTDEVYGSLKKKERSFTETNKFFPNSPYAASKASSDHAVRAYFKTYGFPIIISNCSNNYGPYQYPEKLIPLILLNALSNKILPIYGDGRQVRDWLYVEDHCNAILRILKKGKVGETYNIGGRNEMSNIVLVKKICSYLDTKFKRNKSNSFLNQIRFVDDRLGHDRRYAVDSSKITRDLKWKPDYNFENGIKITIEWYLKNFKWISRKKKQYNKWIKKNYSKRNEKK